MQWLEWQYLIFLMPLVFGVGYLLLMAVGMPFGGESDADVGADVGLDAGGDVAADVDHGLDHHIDVGPLTAVATFLGLGRVPISILLVCYAFVWSVSGLAALSRMGPGRVWTAVAIAAAASIVVTRYVAMALARLVPSVSTYHTPAPELVGLRGTVLYQVTPDSGVVRLTDERGTLRDVSCRVPPGEAAIPTGAGVLLLRYDSAANVFRVTPCR